MADNVLEVKKFVGAFCIPKMIVNAKLMRVTEPECVISARTMVLASEHFDDFCFLSRLVRA